MHKEVFLVRSRPVGLQCAFLVLSLFVVFLPGIVFLSNAFAACDQPQTMRTMVNLSDGIVLGQIEGALRGIELLEAAREVDLWLEVRVTKLLKPSVSGLLAQNERAKILFSQVNIKDFFPSRDVLLFLTQRGDGTWQTLNCGAMSLRSDPARPGTPAVFGICEAIAQLFRGDKYKLEKYCLLAVKGAVPWREAEQQIRLAVPSFGEFRGVGRIFGNPQLLRTKDQNKSVLAVLLVFDVKARKRFFGSQAPRENYPVRVYYSGSSAAMKLILKRAREGARVAVSGRWNELSFVVEQLDFGVRGRDSG